MNYKSRYLLCFTYSIFLHIVDFKKILFMCLGRWDVSLSTAGVLTYFVSCWVPRAQDSNRPTVDAQSATGPYNPAGKRWSPQPQLPLSQVGPGLYTHDTLDPLLSSRGGSGGFTMIPTSQMSLREVRPPPVRGSQC